jgi:uncharacterized phiE125 gp8 family phage protein
MALKLVSGPTQEPVTVEEAKQHMRLEVSDDDALVASYVLAARQWVEGETKRALVTQTWDYAIDYDWPHYYGLDKIILPLNPVQSVTSISYVDGDGASQTLAADQYTVAAREHVSFIEPAYDVAWPEVRCVPSAITVRFVTGYIDDTVSPAVGAVPFGLRTAVLMKAAEMYEHRGDMLPGTLQTHPAIEALISPYRWSGVGS